MTTEPMVNSFVLQNGGTNFAVSMGLGDPTDFGGLAFYTLSNGVLQVNSSLLFRGGEFSQYNGQNTIVSNFLMVGTGTSHGTVFAEYLLAGGTLSVGGGLAEQGADFTQNGGSNSIAGALVLSANPGDPPTWYALGGGTLAVKDISINSGTFFQHTSGNIIQTGLLTLSQGEWRSAAAVQSLGPLQLTVGTSNNSAITFPNGSSALRFANSSSQPWDPSAILYITNWHGSTSGGGGTQLSFGSDSSGLTKQQVGQIRFVLSIGLYPVTILATGEVVPAGATLDFTRNGSTLTFTWPSGWFLQSASNVAGPYFDVPEATSPYPVSMSSPQQYFRLRL